MTDEKVRENRLRRIATRRGYEIRKSRRRDPHALNYGSFTLVNSTVGGAMYHFTDVSLDDIETFFDKPAKAKSGK